MLFHLKSCVKRCRYFIAIRLIPRPEDLRLSDYGCGDAWTVRQVSLHAALFVDVQIKSVRLVSQSVALYLVVRICKGCSNRVSNWI